MGPVGNKPYTKGNKFFPIEVAFKSYQGGFQAWARQVISLMQKGISFSLSRWLSSSSSVGSKPYVKQTCFFLSRWLLSLALVDNKPYAKANTSFPIEVYFKLDFGKHKSYAKVNIQTMANNLEHYHKYK